MFTMEISALGRAWMRVSSDVLLGFDWVLFCQFWCFDQCLNGYNLSFVLWNFLIGWSVRDLYPDLVGCVWFRSYRVLGIIIVDNNNSIKIRKIFFIFNLEKLNEFSKGNFVIIMKSVLNSKALIVLSWCISLINCYEKMDDEGLKGRFLGGHRMPKFLKFRTNEDDISVCIFILI